MKLIDFYSQGKNHCPHCDISMRSGEGYPVIICQRANALDDEVKRRKLKVSHPLTYIFPFGPFDVCYNEDWEKCPFNKSPS